MKVNRTVSLAVVILMVMALVLAACGQDSTPEVALDYDTRGAVRERIAIDTAEDSYIYNGGDIKFYSDNHSTGTITLDAAAGTIDMTGALADSGGTFTFEDNVLIDGQADAVQLAVQGYSTQTSNTFVVETSAGTDLFWVTNVGDVEMNGTTPTLTMGDAGEEDTAVVYDGAAQDFYIGLDDTYDDLVVGLGSTLGTTPAFAVDENLLTTFSGEVASTKVNAASGSANPFDWTGTLGIMNGSDTFHVWDINLTNANHTSTANYVYGIDISGMTADSEAVESALVVGAGWDYGAILNANTLALDIGRTATLAGSAGVATVTLPATGTLSISVGNLKVGDGSPGLTLGGEDAYVEGTFEVDGSVQLDGAAALNGGITVDSTAFVVTDVSGNVATAGTIGQTLVNSAGGSANPYDWTGTLGIMDGSDTFQVFDVNVTNADHTGSANYVYGLDISGMTADAQAVESALVVGAGWDYGAILNANTLALDLGRTATLAGSAGVATVTLPATGTLSISVGNLKVGNGSPGLTLGGEDAYVEGTFEVDSSVQLDGAVAIAGNTTLGAGSSIYPSPSITGTSALFSCVGTLAYTDTTAKGMCIIPANANIVDVATIVTVVFNDSGTDKVACGFDSYSDPDNLVDDLDGEALGLLRAGSGGTLPYAALTDVGASNVTVWCKFTGQNSNASTGALTFILTYHVD